MRATTVVPTESGTREEPRETRGRRDAPGPLVHTTVVADELDAHERSLRSAQVAPALHPRDRVPPPDDTPEEVVGAQEHQVSAEVAVARNGVVHAPGHVLLVPRE